MYLSANCRERGWTWSNASCRALRLLCAARRKAQSILQLPQLHFQTPATSLPRHLTNKRSHVLTPAFPRVSMLKKSAGRRKILQQETAREQRDRHCGFRGSIQTEKNSPVSLSGLIGKFNLTKKRRNLKCASAAEKKFRNDIAAHLQPALFFRAREKNFFDIAPRGLTAEVSRTPKKRQFQTLPHLWGGKKYFRTQIQCAKSAAPQNAGEISRYSPQRSVSKFPFRATREKVSRPREKKRRFGGRPPKLRRATMN
ncbi:MAG: hypothetical protein DBX55_08210 [Verrucomicrobia bacterium]|nr:MAG: hypothetical protein DBX55_08210 [Verrucomicrobiota bacterium]